MTLLTILAPNEFGMDCLPLHQYPPSIVKTLENKIPFFINASNPLRISIFNKEFVFFRKDLLKEFRRNSVVKIDDTDYRPHIITTVVSQSHLMPLSLYSQPIYWDYDYAFRIFKLPDVLIMGDSFTPSYARVVYEKNILANPGSFFKNGSYLVIKPLSNHVEVHKI